MTIYILWSQWLKNKKDLLGVFDSQCKAEEEGSKHWVYQKTLFIEQRTLNKKEDNYTSDLKYTRQFINGYWENYERNKTPF